MDNHTYNLLKELTKKADALTVYDLYIQDSKDCKSCLEIWKKLRKQDEEDLDELKKVLVSHVQENEVK